MSVLKVYQQLNYLLEDRWEIYAAMCNFQFSPSNIVFWMVQRGEDGSVPTTIHRNYFHLTTLRPNVPPPVPISEKIFREIRSKLEDERKYQLEVVRAWVRRLDRAGKVKGAGESLENALTLL